EADRSPLFRALLGATLIVPACETAAPQESLGAPGLQYAVLEHEGRRALAGFTDLDALRRFHAGPLPWVLVRTPALCRVALDGRFDRLLINPGGPVGYEMTRMEFQALAEGRVPDGSERIVIERPTPVEIGMPAVRPPGLVLTAMHAAVACSGAREVYWFW